MIKTIEFKNYRVLRDTTLPLEAFTLLVGPNGSGKSTVLHALRTLRGAMQPVLPDLAEVASLVTPAAETSITATWSEDLGGVRTRVRWRQGSLPEFGFEGSPLATSAVQRQVRRLLVGLRTFSLNENSIAQLTKLTPGVELQEDGAQLAGVLDRMRDETPELFEELNAELRQMLPEFDRILFATPGPGTRGFLLRTSQGKKAVPARNLSQGTLLALTILTLAYLAEPPSIVCIEEPDRGIHPRLYRDVRDALYRLCYPQSFGLTRAPVQVLITTHSPYILDLHREHPEEIIIAEKVGAEGTFSRLSDRGDLDDLLNEATLGEIWYSGVLGGVPAGT